MIFELDRYENLIPNNGIVNYFGKIFHEDESRKLYFKILEEIELKEDEVIIFGKKHVLNRKTAWISNENKTYKYSNIIKISQNWSPTLLKIKTKIEELTNEQFNSCLINFYENGNDGMGWHSDDEKEIIENSTIASFSLGEIRTFKLKHKQTKQIKKFQLENGSLLLMRNETQKYWVHSLPKSKKIKNARLNITFRKIY